MLKKNARNALIVILGVLALIIAIIMIVRHSLGMILPLFVMIFAFSRVCSHNEQNDDKTKECKTDNAWNAELKTDPVKEEKVRERVRTEKDDQPARNDSHKRDLEHVRAISAALYRICCMDIRNIGMNALGKAKDILKERYEENNSCNGFTQFENYYLPTLRKTVENYCSMERKGVATLRMRDDMIAYLKSCDKAFARVYSSMFDDDILSMEVQMEAMNIALKRDGLL